MRMVYMSDETLQQDFAREAAAHFAAHPQHYTYTHGEIEPGCLLAMRYGLGNDCVVVVKLDDYHPPTNYQELIREYSTPSPPDIYVVVTDHDGSEDAGPIVHEEEVSGATLKRAKSRAQMLATRYGNARIAKLQFID